MSSDRDKAYVQHLVSAALTSEDVASGLLTCYATDCGRSFRAGRFLRDHAEAVHTFEDIRRILSEHIREEFGRRGDYSSKPIVPAIWTWIDDLASDWVVFQVEEDNETKLLRSSYAIADGVVTLGEPTEVRRRTVYEPTKKD